jgi:predicted thioredoxin/glutaredoxin
LYRTKDCHLCEVARSLLLSLQRVAPFRIEVVDIAGDADLERRFLLEVPVVEVDGAVVSSGQVDLDAVRAAVNHARIAAARRTATGEG